MRMAAEYLRQGAAGRALEVLESALAPRPTDEWWMDSAVEHGPSRVLIDPAGDATSAKHAREKHGIIPDIIFIRRDGWSLGAPDHLQRDAFLMWRDDWVSFLKRPSIQPQPITEYPLCRKS